MNSDYWKQEHDKLINNPPKSSENYYNQSFVDRISAAQHNVNGLVAERDRSASAKNQAMDGYNSFKGSMKTYDSVFKQAGGEFNTATYQDTYEKSKKALAMAETALETLPSSINAASNRVLTQIQREARYNALSNSYLAVQTQRGAASVAYEDAWRKARENQAAYAKAEIARQQSQLESYATAWNKSVENYNTAEKRLTQGETELRDWQDQYRSWQRGQYTLAYSKWQTEVAQADARYQSALAAEEEQRRIEAEKERRRLEIEAETRRQQAELEAKRQAQEAENARVAAQNERMKQESARRAQEEANRRAQQQRAYGPRTWDFGNGYTLQGSAGGEATYYANGRQISAGQFLENTGATGANWDAWNDVWNSGVSTKGVGSDTVAAFEYVSPADPKYGYLYY